MAITIGVAGLAIAGTGLALGASNASKTAQAQKDALARQQQAQAAQSAASTEIIGDQEQQDAVRRQAMELDSARRRREMVRNSIVAQSTALSNATNSGASHGSALPGSYGSIAGRTNTDELGVNQALYSGRSIFDLNAQIAEGQKKLAAAGGQANFAATAAQTAGVMGAANAATYGGMTSLGNAFLTNSTTISKIGTTVGSWDVLGGFPGGSPGSSE